MIPVHTVKYFKVGKTDMTVCNNLPAKNMLIELATVTKYRKLKSKAHGSNTVTNYSSYKHAEYCRGLLTTFG